MTELDPNTPVCVGVGAVSQREEDPARAAEPLELMVGALTRAAEDAGSRALLTDADWICVPRGFWDYEDPGRGIALRVGAARSKTLLAEIGVLQTTLLGHAAEEIAQGRARIVLVAGGEAKYRSARAQKLGVEAPLAKQTGAVPDRVFRPEADVLTALEIQAGIAMPVNQFSMIENALRYDEGVDIDAHAREVAQLWSAMSQVAAENPEAWVREPLSADAIREPSANNRMLAFPYTKRATSQWNVDQAAGLIFCSIAVARELGIPSDRYVFPWTVADSNYMRPLSERRALHRSPGFAAAAERVFARHQIGAGDLDHLELYSCFPAAVRVQLRELGIDASRALTVTGGMAFAGGPLNNFVLQALVRMLAILRADPGSLGLVTAVSGILMKQGVSLWSTRAADETFAHEQVGEIARDRDDPIEVVDRASGEGRVASYTVLYQDDKPQRAVLFCDLEDGRRTIAHTDAATALAFTREEGCGRRVRCAGGLATLIDESVSA